MPCGAGFRTFSHPLSLCRLDPTPHLQEHHQPTHPVVFLRCPWCWDGAPQSFLVGTQPAPSPLPASSEELGLFPLRAPPLAPIAPPSLPRPLGGSRGRSAPPSHAAHLPCTVCPNRTWFLSYFPPIVFPLSSFSQLQTYFLVHRVLYSVDLC